MCYIKSPFYFELSNNWYKYSHEHNYSNGNKEHNISAVSNK